MTITTTTRFIVRDKAFKKADGGDLYNGHIVRLVDERRDHTGAMSYVFESGPEMGHERWLRDDTLEPWPRPISTENEA